MARASDRRSGRARRSLPKQRKPAGASSGAQSIPLPELNERAQRFANDISSTLVAVRAASERGRAESIRDMVDAYRRLYGSVQRFVAMLSGERLNFAAVGTSGSHSLNQLLSILAERARAAGLARLRELNAAIEQARSAEQLRDAIFSDALSNDMHALREVVARLERLDAAFIGLCVGHVLEQHAGANGDADQRVALHMNRRDAAEQRLQQEQDAARALRESRELGSQPPSAFRIRHG